MSEINGVENQDQDLKNDGQNPEVKPNEEQGANESDSEFQERLEKLEKENASLKRDLKKATKSSKNTDGDSSDLDYGQLAYLTANGIKGDSEIELAQQVVADSGKELKDVINSGYFQAQLKELRDTETAKKAMPESNRNGNVASDNVEYWIAKGELPPKDTHPELRRKVVKAKRDKATRSNKFTDNPIIS